MSFRSIARAQSGFGLIEVLISLLILSIAFLSLSGLVVRSLSSNNGSMARSVATVAIYSIQEMLRADRASAMSGAYNTQFPLNAAACPPAVGTLVSTQLNLWCSQQLANDALGGAVATTTGTISCQTTGVCTITITWDDSHSRPEVGTAAQQQKITSTGAL
jgi:type IV pilus assembly protein PilV